MFIDADTALTHSSVMSLVVTYLIEKKLASLYYETFYIIRGNMDENHFSFIVDFF